MDDITARLIISIILTFVFFGWIPILAIGKAISWIILAFKGIDGELF